MEKFLAAVEQSWGPGRGYNLERHGRWGPNHRPSSSRPPRIRRLYPEGVRPKNVTLGCKEMDLEEIRAFSSWVVEEGIKLFVWGGECNSQLLERLSSL